MNTTRLTLFDSPLFLGFDHFEKTFDRLKKTANQGYPPYNIEQLSENDLRITLAVAGFTMDSLDIELEQNQLTISGKQDDEEGRMYIHRGIATRQFRRSFVLADGIEVRGAMLDNGLLHIDLYRDIQPEKARKIKINTAGGKSAIQQPIDVEARETDSEN